MQEQLTDAELLDALQKRMKDVNNTMLHYLKGLSTSKQAYQHIAAVLCHSLVDIATHSEKIDSGNIRLYAEEIINQLDAKQPQKKVRIANALAEALYCLTISK